VGAFGVEHRDAGGVEPGDELVEVDPVRRHRLASVAGREPGDRTLHLLAAGVGFDEDELTERVSLEHGGVAHRHGDAPS
jgi:hypothetical protein